jgi:hypothetical protein
MFEMQGGFKDEMRSCMTNVETVNLSLAVPTLRRIGEDPKEKTG